jgi:hypothetical protein
MAIKSGTPITAPQRTSSTGGSSRPQLKLPLSGVKSKEQHASAPTMLSNAIDTECPRCGRSIPVDSNFCSFCAADVTGRLSMPDRGASHEAQTIVLDDVAAPGDFPGPIFQSRRRRRRGGRSLAMVVGGCFLLGYFLFHSYQQPSDGDTGPDYGGVPSVPAPDGSAPAAPDAGEPAHTEPREIALRRQLDMEGYASVHFKMDGDTIILWGTVPTEADRLMVQTQIFMFARIFSIEDHIQVRDTFAEP